MASLNGIFTCPKPPLKNYIAENRRKIRQMSGKSASSEGSQSVKPGTRGRSPMRSLKKDAGPPLPDGSEFPLLRSKLFVQCRNQSCQTDNMVDSTIEMIGHSSPFPSPTKSDSTKIEKTLEQVQILQDDNSEVSNNEIEAEVNKENQELLPIPDVRKKVDEVDLSDVHKIAPPYRAKPSSRPQTVPKKSNLKRNTKITKKEVEIIDSDCPPGHVLLSSKQRTEMIERLDRSYENLIHQFNKLPVGADTLRIRTKKMELEKQMNDVEDGLKLLSKPKVYIKLDE